MSICGSFAAFPDPFFVSINIEHHVLSKNLFVRSAQLNAENFSFIQAVYAYLVVKGWFVYYLGDAANVFGHLRKFSSKFFGFICIHIVAFFLLWDARIHLLAKNLSVRYVYF